MISDVDVSTASEIKHGTIWAATPLHSCCCWVALGIGRVRSVLACWLTILHAVHAGLQARLAGQRQRGIVLSAGSTLPLTNAFITLHVLRNHLKCSLPVAIL